MVKIQELAKIVRQEADIIELLEVMSFNFQWLLRFCEKKDISIPDRARIYASLDKVRTLIDEIAPPRNKHPNTTPKESTEPEFE